MKTESLLKKLLGWQLLVTGSACLLLVVGTLLAGVAILRHDQDKVLSALSTTMCVGIKAELADEFRGFDRVLAAEHYFAESPIEGYRLEYCHHLLPGFPRHRLSCHSCRSRG